MKERAGDRTHGRADRPRASRKKSGKERKQGWGVRLFGSAGVNICSIPAIRCQGLMKALNMCPAEGGGRQDL